MKLLAFVDMHSSNSCLVRIEEKALRHNPDVLLVGGDLSFFEDGLELILPRLNMLNVPVLIIPGNHEDPSTLRKLCFGLDNLFFIHKKQMVIKDVLFLGYGGSGFARIDPEFEEASNAFSGMLKHDKTVLLTHAPPYNTKLDLINKEHVGNESIRNFIDHNDITLAVSGHLHENFNRKDRIRNTLVINPGPEGTLIEI